MQIVSFVFYFVPSLLVLLFSFYKYKQKDTASYWLNSGIAVLGFLSSILILIEPHNNQEHSTAFSLVSEMFMLGLLVSVWETLHFMSIANSINKSQLNATKTLLFFMNFIEKNQPEDKIDPDSFKTPFHSSVEETITLAKSYKNFKKHKTKFDIIYKALYKTYSANEVKKTRLYPLPNESFFHNLDNTLTGLQDIVIDGQYREDYIQNSFERMYKSTRMLEFLNKRLSLEDKVKNPIEQINLIQGMVNELNNIANELDHIFNLKSNQYFINVNDAVVARLLHAILHTHEVRSESWDQMQNLLLTNHYVSFKSDKLQFLMFLTEVTKYDLVEITKNKSVAA